MSQSRELVEGGGMDSGRAEKQRWKYQEGRAIEKVRYSHDAMIDLVIAEPWITQCEIAQRFGYSENWVSLVFSSTVFKDRLEQRKAELVDPTIRLTLEERFNALVTRSLEVLQEKLSAPASKIPDALALRAAEMGAKSLGFGQPKQEKAPVAAPDHLDQLAGRLISLQRRTVSQGVVIDEKIDTVEISQSRSSGD